MSRQTAVGARQTLLLSVCPPPLGSQSNNAPTLPSECRKRTTRISNVEHAPCVRAVTVARFDAISKSDQEVPVALVANVKVTNASTHYTHDK
ncbi:unnamed protein product [Penicillium pancosmium]